MKNVIIIGTGGHAKSVTEVVLRSGDFVYGYLTSDKTMTSFLGRPVLGSEEDWKKFKDCFFIIAIGDNAARKRISQNLSGAKWYTAIHPTAVISSLDVSIGEGSVVMANTILNSCSTIGNHCIVNSGSIIEHDNFVDDFSHISVGVKFAGNVKIGKNCFIGIGAAVKENIEICNNCVVGAGVIKNLTEPGTYVGLPAKKIKWSIFKNLNQI